MTWWQILLTGLAVWAAFLGLIVWAKAAAYRREAEEHGDNDGQNP